MYTIYLNYSKSDRTPEIIAMIKRLAITNESLERYALHCEDNLVNHEARSVNYFICGLSYPDCDFLCSKLNQLLAI